MSDSYAHLCTGEDMHPYQCEHKGKCRHCDRRETENHIPAICCLCEDRDIPDEEIRAFLAARAAKPTAT